MEELWEQIQLAFTTYLPNLLLAIGVLIIGWILALVLSSVVRNLLSRTNIDDRLAGALSGDTGGTEQLSVEKWISTAVFWLIMIFTLIVFFQVLDVPAISEPLGNFSEQIVGYIPGILGALVLLLIAWLVATVLRAVVIRVLNASGLTRRLSENAEVRAQDRISISRTIGNVAYWLVFLLFLPAVLDALNLQGILAPVQGLVDEILSFLPNLLGAVLIGVIGWLVARIIRQIVTNILAGIGIDRLWTRAGTSGTSIRLSQVIGTIVYVLILIPVAIAALNALSIPAVSEPASAMLTNLLNALPAIFGAFLLIGIAYFVARVVGGFVATILASIGFDRLFQWLGLYLDPRRETPPPPSMRVEGMETRRAASMAGQGVGPAEAEPGRTTPSKVVGYLVTIAIVLFAVMEAADLLGFEVLSTLISGFIVASGQVLAGLIIFGIGLYLSYLAARVIRESGSSQSHILAPIARTAIIIFSGALALRQMGIAESIVNLAFGLLLGAVAVAAALAFGLGGRETAARQLERWRQQVQQAAQIPATGSSETGDRSETGNPESMDAQRRAQTYDPSDRDKDMPGG